MYGFVSDMCHTHGMPHACYVEVKWLIIGCIYGCPVQFVEVQQEGKGKEGEKRRKEKKGKKEKEGRRRKEKGKKEERKGGGEPKPMWRREQNRTTKDLELRYER